MESSSQSGSPSSNPQPDRLADVVGTIIAILTLVLPTLVISYYSNSSSAIPSATYSSDRYTNR
ncbi:hypothetical protein [Leptodesmis sp.]|uniref:hypothetical protein n=1 Tax=Leptodesmis sp. TaxID=3100501 RepID=UPI0040534977